MKISKSSLSFIVIACVCVTAFAVFALFSIFSDEFDYVFFTYSENSLSMTTDPNDLIDTGAGKWTDVSATFRNNSERTCLVELTSDSLDTSFALDPTQSYGALLPKSEHIFLSFCNIEKDFQIN